MGLLSCGGPIFLLLPHRRNDIIWKINFKPQSWSLCAPFFIKSKLYFSTTLYCLILRCRAPFGHHRTKFLYALLIGRAPQVRHHGHHFAELRPQSEQHTKKEIPWNHWGSRDLWRKRWDSNPRALADNLISSQARYDHFDTLPYRIFDLFNPVTWFWVSSVMTTSIPLQLAVGG